MKTSNFINIFQKIDDYAFMQFNSETKPKNKEYNISSQVAVIISTLFKFQNEEVSYNYNIGEDLPLL